MKKMNRLKLALDALMLIVLLLMYKKDVLGPSFHEIGGMAVCGLFIIHKLLNGKWILAVSGKLFSSKIAWRQKLHWLIDFLMLLCFAYILVSGIFISKVLFDGERGASAFKTGHYAASALALVLAGVHLGLHYESVIKRTPARRLPLGLRRIAAVVMSAAILGFGVYQMTATSFLAWMGSLSAVVNVDAALPEGGFDEAQVPWLADGQEDAALRTGETDAQQPGGGRGNGPPNGEGQGQGNGNGAATDLEVHPEYLGEVLLGFLSITLSFSAAVAWIDGAARAYKRKKLIKRSMTA
jgi:hypothetical protein